MKIYYIVESLGMVPLYSHLRNKDIYIWDFSKWERGKSPEEVIEGPGWRQLNAMLPRKELKTANNIEEISHLIKKSVSKLPYQNGELSVFLFYGDYFEILMIGITYDKNYTYEEIEKVNRKFYNSLGQKYKGLYGGYNKKLRKIIKQLP